MNDEIEINGERYRRVNTGGRQRAFVVVDRGWLYAGDVEDVKDPVRGHIARIHNAIWVFGWSKVGLAKMLDNPNREEVDLRPLPDGANVVEVPGGAGGAEVYRIPVPENWGK